jgi:heme/copper-type cytochrome/quinol oxidase subunit 1
VLSMGAVFAIFSGFYYWFGKMTGLQYPEILGQIHFWSTFLGVNLTFMPMHFLGLAGMPRRIPDYPDAYSGWNAVASYGSYVSLLSTLFFFYVVYVSLTTRNQCVNAPWDFNSAKDKGVYTVEWVTTSPPAYHTFEEIPLICETTSTKI